MKNNFLKALLIILIFSSCNKKADNNGLATIEYTKEIDFGNIKVNDIIVKIYEIKNTSDNILKIKKIKTSCGCTVAKLKDTIIQGKSSTKVEVQFIADKDKVGKINKSIVIDANTNPSFSVMYLKGTVQ